ncbi:hypothetical protein D3C75_733790 [compost metagenome]
MTLDFLFALEYMLFPIMVQGLLSKTVFAFEGKNLPRSVLEQAQLLLMSLLQALTLQFTHL